MQITLVRHGQPQWAHEGLALADPDLTELGHAQARALAAYLPGFDELWVSTAARARSTAAPLARPAIVHDWLHEIRTDALAGRPAEEVAKLFASWRARPVADWWTGIDACEPGRAFVDRVAQGMQAELTARGARSFLDDGAVLWEGLPDLSLVIVCHAGTAGVIIAHLLGVPQVPWPWERFGLMHTGIARLRAEPIAGGQAFTLTSMQDVGHLAAHQRTR